MEDDKKKIEKLEERLAKAADTFKELKVQLDEKDKENAELKVRIKELEDELTLNGSAVPELDGLRARLEKAKVIFTEQKAKITELTAEVGESNKVAESLRVALAESEKQVVELTTTVSNFDQANKELRGVIERVKEIVYTK